MSNMLSRFRKQGGFLQLVQLIETCEPAKKKSLMSLVASEDPGWAHLVLKKSLTVEKILGWPESALMEILPHMPMPLLAVMYNYNDKQTKTRLLASLDARLAKELMKSVENLNENQLTGGQAEVFTASIKLIQLVRELESDGTINLFHIDPTLVIDLKIAS